ncbi:AraC family transcriptional regulator [Clostridium folliculivorans]|uniref:AraC family transcriptional regulator n=1 Tax=Clostridium folliculivorans TaxID=2886038 RepID=UPI0021C3F293|nr:AraC family transcriptional regulator [Clostridium folliculivorans]
MTLLGSPPNLEIFFLTQVKISELIGYNSSDHFSRTSKKYYDCSPYQYRQRYVLER